jgi:hypothetical protein
MLVFLLLEKTMAYFVPVLNLKNRGQERRFQRCFVPNLIPKIHDITSSMDIKFSIELVTSDCLR